ncbi:class I SAM-dependent methyltransferase [Aquiflexum gelatinilyticum]|uniref:Class I SAM-dependent methyltransferase n=1 Tax=Aquiflexum gelatinilyticum TaxID=2961943 RepID=A0A9X2P5Q0_9BACT|nr:class I SAM-dependent methyltransferase [Aquiflexum gelatinilyticum]MCR9015316.1 class I SAM-dependent methyltransferase [Aquiflexum gelatinilyticum]
MKKLFLSFIFLFSMSFLFGQSQTKTDEIYTYKTPDRDGTGKVYMGREISQVMNFMGMSWLERSTRPQEENTELAIKNLPIDKKSVVADIGAGSGYYTFRIAKKVPEGKVYAVEIQDPAIKYLEDRSKELGFDNVVTIKGTEKSPMLPENSIDLAIMVDVYHELEYPHEVLQNIKKSLKPEGKLLLIEYRGEDPKVAIKRLHKMTVEQVTKELSANGFTLVQNGQFMKIQHFLVFEKE